MGLIAGVGDFGLTELQETAVSAKNTATQKATDASASATTASNKALEASQSAALAQQTADSIGNKLQIIQSVNELKAYNSSSFAYFDGSNWEKKSGNKASNGGTHPGTIININSATYWEREFSNLDISFFGANGNGTTDNVDIFQNAINYANEKNINDINIPDGIYYASDFPIGQCSSINFRGNGYIKTPISLDFFQSSQKNGIKSKSFSSIGPYQLQHFISVLGTNEKAKVTFWGTSLSGGNAGTSVVLTPNDTYTKLLEKSLKNAYGEEKIDFFYRGIGGTNALNAKNSVIQSNAPGDFNITNPEYTWGVVGQKWIDIVKGTNPDLLVLGFSMNDFADYLCHKAYKDILLEINTWEKVPSIIIITEPNPTRDDSATTNFQAEQNCSAEFSRSFSKKYNLGLIDFNRQSNIIQNGIDPVNQIAEKYTDAISDITISSTNTQTFPKTSSDFVIDFSANLLAPVSGNFDYISFKLSIHPFDVLRFYPLRTSNQFELQSGVETVNYSVSAFLNNSFYAFKVVKSGSVVSFYMNNQLIFSSKTVLLSQPMLAFSPTIESNKPFLLTNISYIFSSSQRVSASYTSNEIWGIPNGNAQQKIPFGGNGINHPTTLGAKAIYADVIDNINWPFYRSGESSFQPIENQRLSSNNNVVFADVVSNTVFSGLITASKNQSTPVIIESENSNAGTSAGSKFRTRFAGTETSYWWNKFNGGNFQTDLMSADMFTFIVGSLNVMRLMPTGCVVIGGTSGNANAILDIQSTTKGILMPRLTTIQINAISSPTAGLVVYNTTLATLCFYNGTSWQKVTSTAM